MRWYWTTCGARNVLLGLCLWPGLWPLGVRVVVLNNKRHGCIFIFAVQLSVHRLAFYEFRIFTELQVMKPLKLCFMRKEKVRKPGTAPISCRLYVEKTLQQVGCGLSTSVAYLTEYFPCQWQNCSELWPQPVTLMLYDNDYHITTVLVDDYLLVICHFALCLFCCVTSDRSLHKAACLLWWKCSPIFRRKWLQLCGIFFSFTELQVHDNLLI